MWCGVCGSCGICVQFIINVEYQQCILVKVIIVKDTILRIKDILWWGELND